ncbi:hypothetical protein PV08_09727 [Exophiala spinifera]|uniref:Zn(2)-C6 fungal-type domain-containing protein n=1 Tax=Exophiala spinifera TaxID=91928 RepID=A0A0D2B1C0_9EURO|nr:uncharacterized protein PV08_09727 [Exophiala spinifera]KIW12450.1 hypothetical protein PV08_09727 [Exophiala spinifera]
MVFSGRPSGACHACRKKRLKCDQLRPGCSQCARKRILCPGYRPTSDLRIRDETERVGLKSRAYGTGGQGGSARATFADGTQLVESWRGVLNLNTDDDAVSYFMTFYIVSSPFQQYLPGMYDRCSKVGEATTFYLAITAASLAAYARQTGHWGCMDRSRESYVLALNRINKSLTNPVTAALDDTLASILLLGTFESIVFAGARSPEEWTTHLIGASKLLQLRGPGQFKSTTGSCLFGHTAANIYASCMQRFADLPEDFQALSNLAKPFLDSKDVGNRMSPIFQRAVHLKARIANYQTNMLVLYEVFDDAVALERETATLFRADDPEFGYTVRSKKDTPSWAYQGAAYRYKNLRLVKIWNTLRMIRLFLLEVASAGARLAIEEVLPVPETEHFYRVALRDAAYYAAFRENARRLADEIAKEVLGCLPEVVERATSAGPKFSASSRSMVWPLSVIHKNRECPPLAREYARSMAGEIVRELDKLHLVDSRKVINGPESDQDW